jgi:hypothetical protein
MRKLSVLVAATAMILGSAGIAQADLLTNGGFETGDFTGWTVNAGATGVFGPGDRAGYNPHSGNWYAALGTVGSLGTLSQTFSDSAGTPLVISLWLDNNNGLTPNEFRVDFNGATLFDQQNILQTAGYEQLTLDVVGTGSDTLTLFERNDPSYFALDDVSVNPAVAVPEPSSLPLLLAGLTMIGGTFYFGRRKKEARA